MEWAIVIAALLGVFTIAIVVADNAETEAKAKVPPKRGVIVQKIKEYGGSSSSVNVYNGYGGGSSATHYYYKLVIHDNDGTVQDIIRVSEFAFYKFPEGAHIKYAPAKKGLTDIWLDEQ